MIKLRVFVSSVQKEMADERQAVKSLITSDPFLDEHCVPILYEDEPSMLMPQPQGYLDDLAKCQIYLLIIGSEYGKRNKGLSATHHEYHFAKKKDMPILVCVRKDSKLPRDPAEADFIAEIKEDGYKYQPFTDLRKLQKMVLECLTMHVKKQYHIAPSAKAAQEYQASLHTVDTASQFDQQRIPITPGLKTLARVGWDDIDLDIATQMISNSADEPMSSFKDEKIKELLLRRGMLWLSQDNKQVYCSPAGLLLLAKDPTEVFPQSCIRLLLFQGKERDPRPADFLDVNAPIPKALESVLQFIDKNTRHPMRVVGIRRLRLDEYPVAALREAVINAMAHRDYEDASRKIHIELFRDRIEVISPGLLPGGVTLAQMRSGKVHPCSRNPVIAQGLRHLGLMDEMGTGVRRMKQTMLDHGLKPPEYSYRENCFVVTFKGPGEDIGKLKVPDEARTASPSFEDQLNKRQKRIMSHVMHSGSVNRAWCRSEFHIGHDVATSDLTALVEYNLLRRIGKGPSTAYVPAEVPLQEK